MAGDSPSSARPDLRERIALRFFGLVNPLARRMIPAGVPTGAPNVLLVIRGRRSGVERTTPVAVLDIDGHSCVQATYGAGGWARNLRAAGEATVIHSGGRRVRFTPSRSHPRKRQPFFGTRWSRTASCASSADCWARG